MKILNIITVGRTSGGAETTLYSLKEVMEGKGHTVLTLSSDLQKSGEKFNDFEFKSVNSKNPLSFVFQLFNIYSFLTLKNILKNYNPDVVHLHTMWQVSPSVLFLLRKYPTVMTLHGPEAFLTSFIKWLLPKSDFKKTDQNKYILTFKGKIHNFYFQYILKTLYLIGLKNVDLFLAPSKYIEYQAKKDVKKIKQIYNGIKLFSYSNFNYKKKLLYVGRLEEVKGVQSLIYAMPSILEKHPDATLIITGDGSYKSTLKKLVSKLRLKNNIKFKEWINNNELGNYYKQTDILVVPSIWPEVFGRVSIEAMSVGRPVIGTNVGGIPEAITDKKTGYIVEPNNPQQIAVAVVKLFSNKSLLEKMGKNAKERAKNFSIENYARKLEKIYTELINNYNSQ